jgi:hypothetical protein
MHVVIDEKAKYRITLEWVREGRVVVTEWLEAEDAKGVIALCNLNRTKIHGIEKKAS